MNCKVSISEILHTCKVTTMKNEFMIFFSFKITFFIFPMVFMEYGLPPVAQLTFKNFHICLCA